MEKGHNEWFVYWKVILCIWFSFFNIDVYFLSIIVMLIFLFPQKIFSSFMKQQTSLVHIVYCYTKNIIYWSIYRINVFNQRQVMIKQETHGWYRYKKVFDKYRRYIPLENSIANNLNKLQHFQVWLGQSLVKNGQNGSEENGFWKSLIVVNAFSKLFCILFVFLIYTSQSLNRTTQYIGKYSLPFIASFPSVPFCKFA